MHAHPEVGEPERDGVVGVAGGRCHLHAQTGDAEAGGGGERAVRLHEAVRVRRVGGVAEPEAEPDVYQRIGAVRGHRHAELLHQAAGVRRPDLVRDAAEVGDDAFVPVHRQAVAGVVDGRLCAADVVEVGVDDGGERGRGDLPQAGQRGAHLLVALARVDGDDAVGAFDERLVGQAVTHQRPHAWAHRVPLGTDDLAVGEVVDVGDPTVGGRAGTRR